MDEFFPEVHCSVLTYKDKTLKSIIKNIAIVYIIIFAFSSCEKVPKYSKIPQISFEGFEIKRDIYNSLSHVYGDSVTIKINYKDGDGDLGLSTNDLNSYGYNYILDVEERINGEYQELVLDPPLNGKFPKLSTDNVVGPIEGVLNYTVFFPHNFPISPDDTLKFNIKILDRASNESNIITTPSIVVYK
jgi:hypothetical protein